MAPNNGLANAKPKSAETTILKAGTVESRGMGTNINSREVISDQIQRFIHGEGRLSFKAEFRGFFTVWTFVTRLPGPTWVDHHPGYLMRGMAYFPLSGSLIGCFVSVFYDLAHATMGLPLIIASVISETASLWVTGCFHEDGLADSADGIGGGWSRDQILKIMTDTRLGTYGCAILLLYIIAKLELLATLGASVWTLGACSGGGPAIIVTQTLARLTAPLLIKTRDYVDEQGPKYKFYSFFVEAKHLVTWYRAFFAIFTSFCVAALAYGILSAIGLIISVIVAVFFSGRYAEYLLGGVMGDYLGATICVTEVYLLTILVLLPNLEDHSLLLVDIVAMYTDFMRGVLSLDEILDDILNDDRKIALLKFIVVGIFTTIWCSSVGHPPVFVRTSVAAKGETNEVQISLNNNDDGDDEGQVVSALEAVLSDPERDFSSRYDTTRLYLDTLAKPVGSLGTLEDWGARLAVIQASSRPNVDKAVCLIFAADHGVAKDKSEGGANCSAYPQIVTQKVLEALEHNMAGASILAAQNQVNLRVIDVGLVMDTALTIGSSKVITSSEHRVEGGTKNFCKTSALSEEEVNACIIAGREEVQKHIKGSASNVLILGEVGIGNTTTSSALIAALTGVHVSALCDSGATTTRDAEDKSAIAKKVAIVEEAIKFHGASTMLHNPVASLRNVGGAEIATMVGAILEASEMNIAVLIDGFIVTTAAMIACHMSPDASRVLFLATRSTEKGQAVAIDVIQKIAKKNNIPKLSEPALNMGLRMGEGTGALTAMPILRSAAVILSDLATLDAVMNLGKSDSANC